MILIFELHTMHVSAYINYRTKAFLIELFCKGIVNIINCSYLPYQWFIYLKGFEGLTLSVFDAN